MDWYRRDFLRQTIFPSSQSIFLPLQFVANKEQTIESVSLQGNKSPAYVARFSRSKCNGHLCLTGNEDGLVTLIDTSNRNVPLENAVKAKFQAHRNAIFDATFSPDDSLLYTTSGDTSCRIFDSETLSVVGICNGVRSVNDINGHYGSIKSVAPHPTSSVFVTASRDCSIIMWDLRDKNSEKISPEDIFSKFYINPTMVLRSAHTNPKMYLNPAYTYGKENLSNYNQQNSHELASVELNKSGAKLVKNSRINSNDSVTSVCFLHSEYLLASSGMLDNIIRVWDLRKISAYPVFTLCPAGSVQVNTRMHGISCLSLDPHSNLLASCCLDSNIYLYDTLAGINAESILSCKLPNQENVCRYSFYTKIDLYDSALLAGSVDGSIHHWNVRRNGCLMSQYTNGIKVSSAEVSGVAWCLNDSTKFVCSSDDGVVSVIRQERLS